MNRTATRPRTGVAARILLAALLVLGMMAPAAAAPPKAHAAETGNLTVGGKIYYDAYNTNWFDVDGQMAWCGNPSMATPGSGTYAKQPLSAASGRTAELAADIWFSYGSPGFDASIWPDRWYDGSEMTPERYTACAHILMADTYSSSGDFAMFGCSASFREWIGWNVLGFDTAGNVSNEAAAGRVIAARAGEVPSSFEPFMLYTGASTQVMLSFTYSTTVKVSKSASEGWAQNDPDYSLAGAVYGIYRTQGDAEADENRVATITTGADGSGESESLGATRDTFYAKEVSPSPGYALDPNVYEVTPENGYAFASEEPPVTARIVLKKVDAETGAGAAQGDATLDGAVYQASYDRGGETEAVEGTTVDGMIVFEGIPLGEVEIREVSPSGGYLLDREVHRIEVTADMAQSGGAVVEVSPDGEFGELVQRGGFIIGKGDAERYDHEDGTFWNYAQGDATFEGAEFTVYNRSAAAIWHDGNGDGELQEGEMVAPDGVVAVLSTEYNESLDAWTASTGVRALPYGTYEIVETKAPEGYTGEGIVSHVVDIREDGQFDQLVEADGILNEVVRGGVQAQKNDLELEKSEAIGGADHSSLDDEGYLGSSLEGIEFTITNASEHGVMVGGTYYPAGSVVAVIETAWNPEAQAYTAQTASDTLPYGSYTIAETATNDSYLLTDGAPRTFEVREDGVVVTADEDGDGLLWSDQVVRNDMHLQKKGSVDGEKLGLVPFLITNVTTGEAHVAVTDRNGMLSTSSDWRSREEAVNANDTLVDEDYIDSADVVEDSGIWFGLGEHGSTAEPDDALGALPYGEYTIEELRCEANKGYALWSDTFNVSRDTTETSFDIDLGTVDDAPEPRIDTVALDKADGDHSISPVASAVVVDEVSYANMPLEDLVARGWLVDKATGEPLEVDGAEVVFEKAFAPISPYGSVSVELAFDASGLAGTDVVVFEQILLDGEVIAEHADLLDADQTVSVEEAPEIGTVATDAADGDHEASADGTARIDDQVFYSGLEKGEPHRLEGTLMDPETGEPLLVGGEAVTAELEFTPADASGSAVVSFELDASSLEGRSTVVFERLYDAEGNLVASHEDLEDEGQTVSFTEPSPEIGTTATDGDDGDHEAYADGDVTIVDEVRYENLEAGVEHVMVGTLIDRDTASPVEKDGETLTVEVPFTPEEADGTVEVVFHLDGSELAGHTLVAFEELRLDGEIIAEHKDPNDEGQSVLLVEPPADTPPGEESAGKPAGTLPKTGDSLPVVPLACLAGAAALAGVAALMGRRADGPADDERPADGAGDGE